MLTGETLRFLRQAKGIKQITVATALKISQPAYSKIEKSSLIRKEKAELLLVILNCTVDDIEKAQRFLDSIVQG